HPFPRPLYTTQKKKLLFYYDEIINILYQQGKSYVFCIIKCYIKHNNLFEKLKSTLSHNHI
ncbi:unnamed protein product, partial [Rotaria sordida]